MTKRYRLNEKLRVLWLVGLFLLNGLSSVQAKEEIHFSPLPVENLDTLAEKNLPFIQYLEKALKKPVSFQLQKDYSNLIQGVVEGKIDLFTLGPLPYLQLKKVFPNVEPILLLKRESGEARYRCMLTKFRLDQPDPKTRLKIALTQPMSTCGYFKTETLLKQALNKALSQQNYEYTGSHAAAIESVLEGAFDYAGACGCYAKKYQSLGIEIVAQSDFVPGFGLFANTQTMSPETIKAIKKVLLSLSDEELQRLGESYRYGFEEVKGNEYQGLQLPNDIPMQGNISP